MNLFSIFLRHPDKLVCCFKVKLFFFRTYFVEVLVIKKNVSYCIFE